VKGKKENKMLRELFRKNLENAEVIPSPASGDELFRRMGRKEFLRFNASRFNIWYAGAIAAAGAAALIIYLAGGSKEYPELPAPVVPEIAVADEPGHAAWQDVDSDRNLNYLNVIREDGAVTKEQESQKIADSVVSIVIEPKTGVPPRSEIKGSGAEKNIIPVPGADSGKLRSIKKGPDLIRASVTSGCCPLKVGFRTESGPFERYRWSFGDGGYSEEENPEWIFDFAGEYKVTLLTFNSEGSESLASCIITVYPKPVARFEIIEGSNSITDNRISFANYSTDAGKFSWDFGDGNSSGLFEPVHIYREAGNYNISLVVISEAGCSDTLTVSNAFTGSGNYINFPNAFLPNLNGPIGGYYSSSSDDAASVFHPVSSGVSEYQLRIFSKLGVLIFESNDITIGWDGYYKGQLCQSGVYIWKVRGNYINGEPFTKMGDLTLLKY
jgi:PKD repeat protein